MRTAVKIVKHRHKVNRCVLVSPSLHGSTCSLLQEVEKVFCPVRPSYSTVSVNSMRTSMRTFCKQQMNILEA